jgi:hypothetical protein
LAGFNKWVDVLRLIKEYQRGYGVLSDQNGETTKMGRDTQFRPSPSQRTRSLAGLAAAAALAGCGNVYEHLSMGEWREIGQAQPPIPREKGAFVVTTSVEGDGPVVRAGDLVKARVLVTTIDISGRPPKNPKPQVIWVWTGRGPEVGREQEFADLFTFGYLGGERPRIALIGRRLHEQFEIHLEPGAENPTGDMPLRGIIDHPRSRLTISGEIGGQSAVPLEWPGLAADSTGRRNTLGKSLGWCFEV